MKRLSLTVRITVLLGMAVVLLVGGAALLMDQLVDHEVGRRMDSALLTQAQTLASLVSVGPDGLDVSDVLEPRPHQLTARSRDFWAVHCANGVAATSQPAPLIYPAGWLTSTSSEPTFAYLDPRHDTLRAVWFSFKADVESEENRTASTTMSCRIAFIHSRRAMNDILSAIDGILLSIPLLALLAVLLLSPWLIRHGLKPLATLGEAMRGIGPQLPGQRLQATGARELVPLVARFNEVLARMDDGIARERQFAGALAHETRTHLAELRALVEVEQRYPSQRSVHETLGEVGGIVDELQGTVSGLLLLTRLEAGIESMDLVDVRLGDLLAKQLDSVTSLLRQRRLQVDRQDDVDSVILLADRSLLDIVIGNVINNAVAYAPEGGCIGIRLQAQALTIDNAAPDVDADEVARFGQRFWSKHHGMDGHAGLGLALAGAAAVAMRLDLRFALDGGQRLHATLSWPERGASPSGPASASAGADPST
ncbi:MAG TPA: ATP-binding protein [Rhodanobacteraceae bacterium]